MCCQATTNCTLKPRIGIVYFSIRVEMNAKLLLFALAASIQAASNFVASEEDLIAASSQEQGTAHFFGSVRETAVNLFAAENQMKSLDNGAVVYAIKLESEGARGLAVHFESLENIREGQLFVTATDTGDLQAVHIPFELELVGSGSGLLTQYVPGSSLLLEWIGSREQADKASAHIDHLVHDNVGVTALQKSTTQATVVFPTYNTANQCTNDAVCSQGAGYEEQRRSVAQYFFRYNANVYATCSGVMVNTASQNGAQYLLSAEQCIQFSRPRWLREATILFNYQRKRCNDANERQPYYGDQVVGLEIITAAQETDMVLFNVVERIPDAFGVYLAGWDARRRVWEDVVAFNYPLADVKKVVKMSACLGAMVAYGPATYGSRVVNYNLPYFYQMIPTSGRSWAGSTGGPLFNSFGLLIGQLSQIVPRGTSNVCKTREFYGAFAASYFNVGQRSLINFLNSDNFPDNYQNGIFLADARNSGLLKSTGGALAINGGGKSSTSSGSWECDGDVCRRKTKKGGKGKKKSSKKSKKKSKKSKSSSSSSSSSS